MAGKLGKPQPHSEVVNKQPATLLIGYGWVGQFIHKYFTEADYYTPSKGLMSMTTSGEYQRYDRYDSEGPKALSYDYSGRKFDKPTRWDVAFVSVPSPMKKDGSCDISYVEKAIKQWYPFVDLFIIRSTVTPGTIIKLGMEYISNKFVMQPEYIGETLGHPMAELNRQPFIILGGDKGSTHLAAKYWSLVLHAGARIRQVSSMTAELCKYMENSFLAAKVVFVNEFAHLAKEISVDFHELREAWLDDPRINRSHTMVYDNNPGFAGKCLPKDLESIVHYARSVGSPLELVESMLEINTKMRKGVDKK